MKSTLHCSSLHFLSREDYFYTAYDCPMLATRCKDEKWTGLPSLGCSNHKHRASVKT